VLQHAVRSVQGVKENVHKLCCEEYLYFILLALDRSALYLQAKASALRRIPR
jgi:hypothetical protein